jgi:transcriptional regulator with XRE-family HTH domain
MGLKKSLATVLGKEIRTARKDKGISLKDFESRDNSIDRHSLSRIERAEKIPTLETLFKICQILQISVSDLIKRVEEVLKR